MTFRVLSVIGTRPEAIKMAPVVKALENSDRFKSLVCTSGQHREMLTQVLDLFHIKPDVDLAVMKHAQDLAHITSSVLTGTGKALRELKPDLVLVQGDTTTAFAAGLSSFYENIPVGHVEAGLRTFNLNAPWPEELNRKMIGTFARLHFAPTQRAAQNLKAEGVPAEAIHITGNTVIDALLRTSERLKNDEALAKEIEAELPSLDGQRRMILVTGHRRENFGPGFKNVCEALLQLADRGDVQIVYPVHLNPRVRGPVFEILGGHKNILLIEPLGYLPFVSLMNRSHFIISDSGGIQEEAPSLGKPVLVTRRVTERPEAVDAGTVHLVGTNSATLISWANRLLDDPKLYESMRFAHNPYGDGQSSGRIIDILSSYLSLHKRETRD